MLPLYHHDPKPTPTNQNPTPITLDPITNHRERPQMTGRYPLASTALPTSLATVFTASKSSLEAVGKPASIMSTSRLASYQDMSRCDWGCNWDSDRGKVWVWEWSLMGFDGEKHGVGDGETEWE